jgi:predicted S18 family serine protease
METLPQVNDSECISFVNLLKKRTTTLCHYLILSDAGLITSILNGTELKSLLQESEDFAKTYSVSFTQIPYF